MLRMVESVQTFPRNTPILTRNIVQESNWQSTAAVIDGQSKNQVPAQYPNSYRNLGSRSFHIVTFFLKVVLEQIITIERSDGLSRGGSLNNGLLLAAVPDAASTAGNEPPTV